MLLILTHENADFDAVASQLAAHKLYPDAVPLLPRRINRNVSQFLSLYWDALPFVRADDWQRRRVNEVVVVDTQSLNSVRGVVRKPKVRVIDHHVIHRRHEDWTYQVAAVGATTTILVEMLQTSGLRLAAEESTFLLLGIYEDTGSLTYGTTTPRDIRASAYLLENGAQLSVVRRFMNVALTAEQRTLYGALQESAEWIDVAGHSVVMASAVAPEGFDDEISSVAHRLRDALSAVALFVLVELHRDVQLVARSTNNYVDVSVVARMLGGGGHDRAAAAMVTGRGLSEVAAEIRQILPLAVKPMATVAQIMSYGVQMLDPDTKVSDAVRVMQRFGYEGYPVIDKAQKLVGLLTRRAVDRATSHGLGHLPISRVMRAGSVMVTPDDSIQRVQELMLAEGWGQIPVVPAPGSGNGRPIGVVTRTDLLNHLFKPAAAQPELDVRQLLADSFSTALWRMLLAVSEQADALQMPLYFVGGVVRDLLLHNPATDFDMVVEGDAIRLVRRLSDQFGGEIHTHSRFGTGKWFVTPDVWRAVAPNEDLDGVTATIDFVTARSEFYTEPSALPEVERGSIKLDLHRRDFTINTLAVRLDGPHLGELLDFYGGRRDLDQGVIRVLHSLSFIDDPTRILRAIRLEQRLGFRIEPRTTELIDAALPMLDRVTGSRIRHEIELSLHEVNPIQVMERMASMGVMEHIHPELNWTAEITQSYMRIPRLRTDPIWQQRLVAEEMLFLYFALWLNPLSVEHKVEVMERLRVRKATRMDVLAVNRLANHLDKLDADASPSQIEQALRPFHPRVLTVARVAATDDRWRQQLDLYYGRLRSVSTVLNGDDLRGMGIKPGPLYGRVLDALLAARLDGQVSDEAEERDLLAALLAEASSDTETAQVGTDAG